MQCLSFNVAFVHVWTYKSLVVYRPCHWLIFNLTFVFIVLQQLLSSRSAFSIASLLAGLLKFSMHPAGLVKIWITGPHHQSFQFSRSEVGGPSLCISNNLPVMADRACGDPGYEKPLPTALTSLASYSFSSPSPPFLCTLLTHHPFLFSFLFLTSLNGVGLKSWPRPCFAHPPNSAWQCDPFLWILSSPLLKTL